jgi:SNF2 family DNA or RNA helicase
MFREAYFSKEHNIWAKSRYAFNYTFDKNKTAQFSRRMQHRSITYEEHECTDVPKVQEIRVPVKLRGEARQYYERVNEEIVELAKSGGASLEATKNVFLRMRQITSGFLGFKNDDTGERAQVVFKQNAKLDALLEELGGMPEGRKAVVFYEYTWSGRRISEELKAGGIGHAWLWSGTKNYRKELDRFMKNKSCLVLVLQSKLGAYSLDGLQEVANYLFYYESPVPVIDRRQSEKRIKRPGQKRRVYQYDLVCQGTVDEKILTFHKEGSDLMRSVRKDPRVLL